MTAKKAPKALSAPLALPSPAPSPGAGSPPGSTPENGVALRPGSPEQGFVELLDLALDHPGQHRPFLNLYRVPSNGDDSAASFVDRMPIGDVADARWWVARHPQGGPGFYRLDLLDKSARPVKRARFSVDSDLRPSPATQTTAAPPALPMTVTAPTPAQSVDTVQMLMIELRQSQAETQKLAELVRAQLQGGGPVSALSPMQLAKEIVEMSRGVATAPVAAVKIPDSLDPQALVKLGMDVGRELGAGALAAEPTGLGGLLVKHMPKLLDMGEVGLELVKGALAERRAARSGATTPEPTPEPTPAPTPEPEVIDAPPRDA